MAFLLHHLLTRTAEKNPETEALRFNGEAMTYAELDRRTNQVARTLQGAGVQRGDRIGIYVNKSPASVIAVFGILKAGGVYVPLDPNAPADRLGYIVRNCGIRAAVSAPGKMAGLAEIAAKQTRLERVVLLEPAEDTPVENPGAVEVVTWDQVLQAGDDPVPGDGTIDADLAYILYTSGSTGDPKGVMIAHRTIFTFIDWCAATFAIGPGDRVTSHAPLHFDLSTFDLFVSIRAGATIILVPEKLSVFPVNLVKLLQTERVTVTYMVPSIYSMMVNYGKLDRYDLSALRLVLFAGEVFPIKYLRRLVAAVPDAAYYNLYGPTETNVCTYYRVRPEDLDPERTEPVPIGISCENMEAFALDEDGRRITTPGGEGELWVRGGCVALGYWGDPEKTAGVFVRNPDGPHFDEIAYRTGDLVRLAEDARNWIFLGRRDHMVKSRGYRIELGDVETALYGFPGVKEAAVIAVPDELVGSRLRAFIVPADPDRITLPDVKVYCAGKLPGYMVPESFEFLDELPKTSTGKVDRTRLAAASGGHSL